jgi:hypothetical protein
MDMRFKLCLAALAAATAFASPAYAQVATDTETAEARGLVLLPLTLTRVQDLDFGTVLASPAPGTVTINADTGNRTVGGGVTGIASNPGQRALFAGAGTAGQDVDLTLAPPAFLVSGANVISVNSMVLDNGNLTTRTIGSASAAPSELRPTSPTACTSPTSTSPPNISKRHKLR